MLIGPTGRPLTADNAVQKPANSNDARVTTHRQREQTPSAGEVSLIRSATQPGDESEAQKYQRFTKASESAVNHQAVSLYLQLDKMEQREKIKSMFGVDTFA